MIDLNQRIPLHTITRANGTIECKKIKIKLESPVPTDKDPAWLINVHARERNGKIFVSADQYASLKELSTVLAIWLIPTLKRMGVSPTGFVKRLTVGFENIQKNKGM